MILLTTGRRYFKFLFFICFSLLTTAQVRGQKGDDALKKRPNILFCIADDMSLQFLNAYKPTPWVNTPVIDRLAKNGVLFSNAYTPNSKCAPSRSSILTGLNPWQLEEAANHVPYFPDKFSSFVEILAEHAYQTGFSGKGWAPGKVGMRNNQPRQLTGKPYNQIKRTPPTTEISNIDYAENFRLFLKERPHDSPFCFWFGGLEPHRKYKYGSGAAIGNKKTTDIPAVPNYWPDNEVVRNDMLDYAFEVEYFDQQIGKFLSILEETGELDNTLIIVTSDNGMPFPRVKGNVYEFSNHLPLIAMWKDGISKPGRKMDDFVSFIDFAPTMLQLAGVELNRPNSPKMQGKSILPLLLSEQSGNIDPTRNQVLLGRERTDIGRPDDQGYPIRAIVKNDFLYLINYEPLRWPAGNPETGYLDADGSPTKTEILNRRRKQRRDSYWDLSFGKRPPEELYRIDTDPDGMKNLASDKNYKKVRKSLRKELENELSKQGDPRMEGKGAIFDQYKFANDANRDFYNRMKKGEQLKAGWVNQTDFEKPGRVEKDGN